MTTNNEGNSNDILRKNIVVTLENKGLRLDRFCCENFAEFPSKKSAYKAIKRGCILLDHKSAQPQWQVNLGQTITIIEEKRTIPPVYDFHFPVIFEDDYLAIIEKPAGIPVSGNYARTIERALSANLQPSKQLDALPWPRPVHRLDAPTGGLLICAKSAKAMMNLGQQFEKREVRKLYQAIASGNIADDGEVRTPLNERTAHTSFKTINRHRSLHDEWLSLVELTPHTGRTHQLRRHLAELGHPIIGDKKYGNQGHIYKEKGLFLWAIKLDFQHPCEPRKLNFKIDLPAKFKSYLKREQRRWESYH